MKSAIEKRSVILEGHKTSVSLEDAFWNALKELAHAQATTISRLIAAIDRDRENGNLSSAIRLYVLDTFRRNATPKLPASGASRDQNAA